MRQKLLFLTLILALHSLLIAQKYCNPADNCINAPLLNLNGYIGNTANFTPSNNPILCPNGQPWGVHNDLWIKFIPTQSALEINLDVLGSCTGQSIQALIHDNCNANPIDCDVDCGGNPSVGGGLTFIPYQEYYLRIDGCSGSICPFQISVNPPSAIFTKIDSIIPKLEQIIGFDTISCISSNSVNYCALSNIDCDVRFNWKIESGNAIFDETNSNIIDIDPNKELTNIYKTGINSNCVKIFFLDTGIVSIKTLIISKYDSSNVLNKNIIVKRPNSVKLDVAICPNIIAYENDSLPGGPFPAGVPCGSLEKYEIIRVDNNGCEYATKLSVKQQCDTVFNLGEIVLCPKEKFIVGDYEFDSTLKGHHEVIVNAKPNQNANLNPPRCDSTKIFYLIPTKINQIISPSNYTLTCENAKITLNAKQTNWAPNDTNTIISVNNQWQNYTPAPGNGWQNIIGANADTLLVDEPGRFRLITSLEIKYKDGFGNKLTKICSEISNNIIVNAPDSLNLFFPKYDIESYTCTGIPYHLKIKDPDPNLIYTWVKLPQNDTIIGSELTLNMNSPYQIIGLIANSDCKKSQIRYDTIYNISENPVAENIALQGYNTACVGNEIGLRLINYNNYKISLKTSDSLSFRILGDSVYLNFKYPGIYQISFNISTLCNARTIVKTFYIDESVQNTIVFGLKTVIEKSTNIYCNNNSNPNFQTKWLTSKNLKFKNYNSNPNCIAVTFPKGISTGWIKSTVYNNCSEKSDSIFVLSKPKFFTEAIEEINSNDISINERYQHNEMSTMMIIPNPAINSIELKATSPFDEIEIIDILGSSKKMMNENNIFDISNLNSGFYIVKIFSNNKEISKNTFIKIY